MRSLFPIFLFTTFVFLFSGCGPIYKTEYSYVPPRSDMGKMCISQCVQSKGMCEQMCQMRNETCRMRAHREARRQFEVYERKTRARGEPVQRDVNDFDDSYFRCNQECDCASSFNSCYSACGGQVLERQVCTAFCNQK